MNSQGTPALQALITLRTSEDVLLGMKAARMKYDFALAHAAHDAERGFAEIISHLSSLEYGKDE